MISKTRDGSVSTLCNTVDTYSPFDDFHLDTSEKKISTYEIGNDSHKVASDVGSFLLLGIPTNVAKIVGTLCQI